MCCTTTPCSQVTIGRHPVCTVLYAASAVGDHKVVTEILRLRPEVDVNSETTDAFPQAPLHAACHYGHIQCVEESGTFYSTNNSRGFF